MLGKIVARNLLWTGIWSAIYWIEVIPALFDIPPIIAPGMMDIPSWLFPLVVIVGLSFWRKILFGNYPRISEFILIGYILMVSILALVFSSDIWGQGIGAVVAASTFVLGFVALVNSRTE